MKILDKYKAVMDRAILGTSDNHPEINIGNQIRSAYYNYIRETLRFGIDEGISKFCQNFSRRNKKYGLELRESLHSFYKENNFDVALGFLDVLKDFCENNYKNNSLSENEQNALLIYYIEYLKLLENPNDTLSNQKIKFNKLDNLLTCLPQTMNVYYKSIKEKKAYDFKDIELVEVTKTAKSYLTNVNNLGGLVNSMSGELLDGKISVASDRGYRNRPNKTQQDAVLSIAKGKNCYLNVVADGVGGSAEGEKASEFTIQCLKQWFENLSEEAINFITIEDIDQVLKKINDEILKNYHGRSQTTLVLALTRNDGTIIANIGDSTAYRYDSEKDKLEELTVTDSMAQGLEYEEARNLIGNNQIFKALGGRPSNIYSKLAHYTKTPNNGERIILSSDGVNDLIEGNRFKDYFTNKTSAYKIVEDAVYSPDRSRTGKMEDNVSAIVIDLPNNTYERRKGR